MLEYKIKKLSTIFLFIFVAFALLPSSDFLYIVSAVEYDYGDSNITYLSSCRDLDVAGVYKLNTSVSSTGSCFSIVTNGVTLDCDGNTISFGAEGESVSGVFSEYSDTIIRNCVFEDDQTFSADGAGIVLNLADDSQIQSNEFQINDEGVFGILITGSNNVEISSNDFAILSDSSYAVYLGEGSSSIEILDNTVDSSGDYSSALNLEGVENIDVLDNLLETSGSESHGIYLVDSSGCNFEGNTIHAPISSSYGVYLVGSSNNEFTDNDISSNGEDSFGFSLEGSSENLVSSNNIIVGGHYSAGYYESEYSSDNVLDSNIIIANTDECYGIYLEGTSGGTFTDNSVSTSGDYAHAFIISESNSNTIEGISLSTSGLGSCGFYFDESSNSNNFSNVLVETSGADSYPFYSRYSEDYLTLKDSVLDSSRGGVKEVYFDRELDREGVGMYEFINVTYDEDYWAPSSIHEFYRKWYLDVFVSSQKGRPIQSADVLVSLDGETFIETVTSSSGYTPKAIVNGYYRNSAEWVEEILSYNILAIHEEEPTESSIAVDGNKQVNFEFYVASEDVSTTSSRSVSCETDWVCSDWSSCVDGVKTRECEKADESCDAPEMPKLNNSCNVKADKAGIRETLFDINLDLLDNRLLVDDQILLARIFLLNIGVPQETNATLYYEIEDSKGHIVLSREEVVTVQTQAEFIERINVSTLGEGRYTLILDLKYEGQEEPASSKVIFRKGKGMFYDNAWFYLIILGAIFLVLFFVFRKQVFDFFFNLQYWIKDKMSGYSYFMRRV